MHSTNSCAGRTDWAALRRAALTALLLAAGPGRFQPVQAQTRFTRPPSIDSLRAVARRDSNDAEVHYALGVALLGKKRWDAADSALRATIAVAPAFADAYLALSTIPESRGELYWFQHSRSEGPERMQREFREAGENFRRAFLLNPLVDLGVLRKAEASSRQFVATSRGILFLSAPWWERELVKGFNELREGKYDKAYERVTRLMQRPEFGGSDLNVPPTILWCHGLVAARLGQFEPAIRDFAVLTGRSFAKEQDSTAGGLPFPTNEYRFLLASMLMLAGRHEQAIPVFRRVLEFDLGIYQAHSRLADMYEAAGEWDGALAERRRAVETNQDEAEPLLELAATLLRAERVAEAMDALARAEALNGRDARIPFRRAALAAAVGDRALAVSSYERFLAIAPSRMGEQIAEARRHLAAPQ